jgi:hypothetical protein
MSYGRLKEQEAALSAELDALIEQASRCGREEDKTYQERTGYELPRGTQNTNKASCLKSKPLKALEQREE